MQSEQINELLAALCKAQTVMQGAVEDSNNPFFKSTYADLTSVWNACRKPLVENGLSVVQTLQTIEGQLCLVSILGHSSGQWIKSMIPVNPSKNDIQALGSAITYCRRYSLAALVGVCPADDDGESAMDRKEPKEMKIEFSIDVNEDIVRKFIDESAKSNKITKSYVIEKANKNPEGFVKSLKVWMDKNDIIG